MAEIIEFPQDFDVERYIKKLEEVKGIPLSTPIKNCLRINIPDLVKMWQEIKPEFRFQADLLASKEEIENALNEAVRVLFKDIREKEWQIIRYMMGMQVRICELEYQLALAEINSPPNT